MKKSPTREGAWRFAKRERLKRRNEIARVFKKGRSVACPGARLFYINNGLDYNRIVFTFARKYGNAVQRNRARRLGREAYRLLRGGMSAGFDLALLVYPAAKKGIEGGLEPGGKSETLRPVLAGRMRQFETLIKKAGLV